MVFLTTFLVLAVFGIIDAGYLYYEHRRGNKTLICPMDHDCSVVTESQWARTMGIRNEVLGFVFYGSVFGLALSPLVAGANPEMINTWLMFATTAGLVFSVFLTAVQIVSIKDYCFYCLISTAITLLLFINSFYLNY